MALDHIQIEIYPYRHTYGYTETVYEIRASVGGIEYKRMRSEMAVPPHLSEIEFVGRMIQELLLTIREEDEDTSSR